MLLSTTFVLAGPSPCYSLLPVCQLFPVGVAGLCVEGMGQLVLCWKAALCELPVNMPHFTDITNIAGVRGDSFVNDSIDMKLLPKYISICTVAKVMNPDLYLLLKKVFSFI